MHEYRPFRDHGQGLLYMSAPLWLRQHTFPFHLRLKAAFPWLEMKHQRHLTRAEEVEQRRAHLIGKRPYPRTAYPETTSQPRCFIIELLTLLSCSTAMLVSKTCSITTELFALIKFPSLHSKLGIPIGSELAPMTIG